MANDDDRLPASLQESIATAICLCNDENSTLINGLVESTLFDAPLDEMVLQSSLYRKQYNRPPGPSHIDDVFSDIMGDERHRQHSLYRRIVNNMLRYHEDLNTEYVLNQVSGFIRLKLMRAGIAQAVDRYGKGGENIFEDLEDIFRKTLKIRDQKRDNGFALSDPRALSFLDRSENEYCPLDIPEFDMNGVRPAKKELFLFIAARNRGKSMFLNLCGRQVLTTRPNWKVMHYTLENSAEMTAQRYFQCLYSGVKRHGSYYVTTFEDEDGEPVIKGQKIIPEFFISDQDNTLRFLQDKMKKWTVNKLENLRIKAYPTGRMTVDDIERDLDALALTDKFVPDMVLIDYPQIMKLDKGAQTFEVLDRLVIDLRGLAVERNFALVCPQQGNRASETASSVRGHHTAGSIGMLATADNAITYSQTAAEEKHGIARLYAQKVRNDAARFSVCISQHYPTAQFIMQSRPLTNKLMNAIKAFTGLTDKETDEDEESN